MYTANYKPTVIEIKFVILSWKVSAQTLQHV